MGLSTGNGASLVRTDLGSLDIVSISISGASVEPVDTTLLSEGDWTTKIPGDVGEPGSITVTCYMDSEATTDYYAAVAGTTSLATAVNFPLTKVAPVANALIAGNAIITEWKPPDFVNNEVQTITFTIQFDDAPTFSEET